VDEETTGNLSFLCNALNPGLWRLPPFRDIAAR
jgi:hypothetical protein